MGENTPWADEGGRRHVGGHVDEGRRWMHRGAVCRRGQKEERTMDAVREPGGREKKETMRPVEPMETPGEDQEVGVPRSKSVGT